MTEPKCRVTTPAVKQYEAVECGAACLKIILGYYGRHVPLSDIRNLCGVSRDGVNALQLKRVATSFGLLVRAYTCSAEQLWTNPPVPCIIHWDFDHFLVIEGFSDKYAFLNDPMYGRRRIYLEDFEECFTGVVLELAPGQDFSTGGQIENLYRWLPSFILPYKRFFPWLLLLSLSTALPQLFIAGATSQFIDSFLLEGRRNIAVPAILVTAIAIVVLIILLSIQKLILRVIGTLLVKRLSSFLYISIFSLPYCFFIQRMRGEVSSRLLLPFLVVQVSVNGFADFILSAGPGILALLVGLFISPLLSFITLFVATVSVVFTIAIRNSRIAANYNLAYLDGKADGIGMNVIQSIETVKASGLENEAFINWSAVFAELSLEIQHQSLASSLIGLIGSTSGFLLRLSVILLGGYLIISGLLTLGELMAFQFLVGLIEEPLMQMGLLVTQLQELDGELGRINDVLDTEVDPLVRSFSEYTRPSVYSVTDSPRAHKLSGSVVVSDLCFRYSNTSPMILDHINISLTAGQHISIVGDSGSGKSTLLRLLAGIESPTHGKIHYDGLTWMDCDDSTLRSSIGLVSQDVFLFSATLEQNITLWDPQFSSMAASTVLDRLGLLKELGGPSAVTLQINEGGTILSGGQRQRIEIARALIRNPSLLLMDEATSSLDPYCEKEIIANIKHTSRTLITVAHRLYTAQVSDLVLVLDQGKIVEQGRPCDLASAGGCYQQLLEAESEL
jgi:ABC-type bacteriocin/lantibiotic exporter with double-glycine peptidase domain